MLLYFRYTFNGRSKRRPYMSLRETTPPAGTPPQRGMGDCCRGRGILLLRFEHDVDAFACDHALAAEFVHCAVQGCAAEAQALRQRGAAWHGADQAVLLVQHGDCAQMALAHPRDEVIARVRAYYETPWQRTLGEPRAVQ